MTTTRFLMLSLMLAATSVPAWAQFSRQCLPQNDAGNALSLLIESDATVRIFHMFKLGGGHLTQTVLEPDGNSATTIVAERVLRLGSFEVQHSDATLTADEQARLCYFHGGSRTLTVSIETDDGWVNEAVGEAVGEDDSCAILMDGERLTVLFKHNGALRSAWRRGAEDWVMGVVENGASVGQQVDAIRLRNGDLVAAHRDDVGNLRVSWRGANGWRTEAVNDNGVAAGWRPSVSEDVGGDVNIVHGNAPGDSDSGLLLARGHMGAFESLVLSDDNVGGSLQSATYRGQLRIGVRALRRSALFGAYDGLFMYENAGPGQRIRLEDSDAARQRHTFKDLSLSLDPFGEPVLLFFDDAAPFGNLPGGGSTCVYRRDDADADGVPDVTEALWGTNPDAPDTDGDGRTDAEELLVDGTNPDGEGERPPEPDAGLPPIPDAGVEVDAGFDADASVRPDAELPADGGADDDSGRIFDATADASPLIDSDTVRDVGGDDGGSQDALIGPTGDGAIVGFDASIQDARVDAALYDFGGGVTQPANGCQATPGRGHGLFWALFALPLLAWGRRRR